MMEPDEPHLPDWRTANGPREESVRARMASLLFDIADRNPDMSWVDLAAFGIRALDGEK